MDRPITRRPLLPIGSPYWTRTSGVPLPKAGPAKSIRKAGYGETVPPLNWTRSASEGYWCGPRALKRCATHRHGPAHRCEYCWRRPPPPYTGIFSLPPASAGVSPAGTIATGDKWPPAPELPSKTCLEDPTQGWHTFSAMTPLRRCHRCRAAWLVNCSAGRRLRPMGSGRCGCGLCR